MENGDIAGEIEPRFTRVTGIEEEGVSDLLAKRLVRVAEDHHVRRFANDAALKGIRRFARVNNVMHEEFAATELDHLRLLEIKSRVVVPEHGGHPRGLFQVPNPSRRP